MRLLPALAVACATLTTSFEAVAQHPVCGKAPEFDSRLENSERIKGDLAGRAQALARFVGTAEVSGRIEVERREIYKSSVGTEAARADAYLAYVFCVLIMDDRSIPTTEKLKAIQEFRRPLAAAAPPTIDLTPDRSTAAETKVILSSFGQFAYSVSNLGWADDMRDVEYSLWALVGGRIVKLHERAGVFIGKGEYSAADNLRRPFDVGKMIVCVSYVFKGRRANVVEFFSNEGASSVERQMGAMQRFRPSIRQMADRSLCKSMPEAVAGLI